MAPASTFEQIIEVRQNDLDELNHVNNVRYVDWVQEVSKEHWKKATTPEMRSAFIWVVRKHEITYRKPAILGDVLRVKTYIAGSRGSISTRIVEFWNHKTQKLVVKASTDWCLLDATTFKPKRVPIQIDDLFH